MKISLKQVLAVGALAVASTSAFADIAAPSTGNGELALVVWDQTTGISYTRGLQLNMDSIATTAQIVADGSYTAGSTAFNIPTTLNVGPDANLTAFLGSIAAGHTVTWGVIGGATGGPSGLANKRFVTTATIDAATASTNTTNGKLTANWSGLQTWDTTFNSNIELSQPSGVSVAGDGLSNKPSAFSAGFTSVMSTWSGAFTAGNQVALGSAANFYLVTTSSALNSNNARVYTLAGLSLSSNGTLTSAAVGGAPVPVPAALWLLGSGLAGLVGIGRRKQVAPVAA